MTHDTIFIERFLKARIGVTTLDRILLMMQDYDCDVHDKDEEVEASLNTLLGDTARLYSPIILQLFGIKSY